MITNDQFHKCKDGLLKMVAVQYPLIVTFQFVKNLALVLMMQEKS